MEHITDDEAEETFKDFEEFRSMQDNNMYGVEQDSDDKVIKVNAKTTTEESGRGGKMITVSEADERKVKETVSSSNFTSDPVSLEENNVGDRDDVVSYKEELDSTDCKIPIHTASTTDIDGSNKVVIKTESITGGYTFKCTICSKCYKCRKSADYHVKIKHKAYSLFCQVCGKTFKLKYDLDRHLNVHSGIRPYPCPECDKSFVCRSSQMRHRKFHHLVGDIYKCHNCDKTFRAESDLKRHLFTHTGERPWSCDQCPKSFVSKSSLKVHEKSHDDSQKFSCVVCKKMFHIKTDLTRHESTHTGDLKWECAICQKKYSGKSAVKRHIKDAHIFGKVKYRKDKLKIEDLLDSISESSGELKQFEAFAKYREDNSVENLLKAVDSFVIYRGDNKDAQTK